jgi:hypothetical protein
MVMAGMAAMVGMAATAVMVVMVVMAAEWLELQLLVWPWELSPVTLGDRTNIIMGMHTLGLKTTLHQREVAGLEKDGAAIKPNGM